jgi:hypothetical protein
VVIGNGEIIVRKARVIPRVGTRYVPGHISAIRRPAGTITSERHVYDDGVDQGVKETPREAVRRDDAGRR